MHLNVVSYRLTRLAGELVSAGVCALSGRAHLVRAAALTLGLGAAFSANALNVLIVDTGAYSGTTAALTDRQTVAGNTTTVMGVGALPASLAGYDQIWDLGYNSAMSGAYTGALTSYLQGGGTLFLMGENPGAAPTRDPQIASFLTGLGAGSVTMGGYGPGAETIASQFLVNNPTSSVTFAGSGTFATVGNGACITSACTAAAWGVGTLGNAATGTVISVLDINFLTNGYLAPAFTDNLIAYLAQQQQIGGGGTPQPTDIDSSAGSFAASKLGTTLNPAFKGGTLNIDAPQMALTQNFTVSGAGGTLQVNGTSATLSGVISDEVAGTAGAVHITGTGGTVTLTGVNTYTGATTVAAGATLALSGAGSIASSSGVDVAGTLNLGAASGGVSLKAITGNGQVALGANGLTLTAASGSFGGTIAGTGGVSIAGGTQTLSGVNSYTGATSIASGATLALSGAGSVAASSGLANAGTLDISGTTAGASVKTLSGAGNVVLGARTLTVNNASGFTGVMSGTGGLTVTGGSMTIANTQTFTGLTTIGNSALVSVNGRLAGGVAVQSGGTLHGSGVIGGPVTVASGGKFSPGNSPGVLTVNAPVNLAAGAIFEVDINGISAGNGAGHYDQVNLVGSGARFNANGATLTVNLTAISGLGTYTPYVPQLGDSFRIVTAEGGIGATRFASITQPGGLAAGTRLRVVYGAGGASAIDLRVVPTSFADYGTGRGLNRNAVSAAQAIDTLLTAVDAGTASATQQQLSNTILGLTGAQFDGAIAGVAGEIHGAMAAAQGAAGQGAMGAVSKHLTVAGNSRLWLDYATGDARTTGDAVASSTRGSRNQFTLGVDLLQSETTRAGVAIVQSTSQVSASSGGTGSLEDNLGVVYGQQAVGGWTVDAQLGHGNGHSRTGRANPLQALDAIAYGGALSTDLGTSQSFAGLGLRAPSYSVAGLTLEPFARVGVQRVKRDAGVEGGAGAASPTALSLAALSMRGTRVAAGLTVASTATDPMIASHTFRGTVAVGQDSGSLTRPTVRAMLAGVATTIEAPQVGRAFVQGNVTGTWLLTRSAYLYAGISGEARSQRTETSVNAGATIAF
ncbi:autotransporter outer membrane beta-barrel domain-containing protein [Roseateles chitosanitabidus]|uniref:autotransporter outer membrane beta-barrel domain-containing protein n=1 Tax=Roseateles chitosanitabidus TaxID=65048 RepID=UPI000A568493|nr:autotransporter outer membrane beta-barrel domain-containing protein [Roseateles chitosanitabidus]